jgi:hypothetical protein
VLAGMYGNFFDSYDVNVLTHLSSKRVSGTLGLIDIKAFPDLNQHGA